PTIVLHDTPTPTTHSTPFPYTTLFRSQQTQNHDATTMGTLAAAYAEAGRFTDAAATAQKAANLAAAAGNSRFATINTQLMQLYRDRKSTRLNSSHGSISYAVFCLKKKI